MKDNHFQDEDVLTRFQQTHSLRFTLDKVKAMMREVEFAINQLPEDLTQVTPDDIGAYLNAYARLTVYGDILIHHPDIAMSFEAFRMQHYMMLEAKLNRGEG